MTSHPGFDPDEVVPRSAREPAEPAPRDPSQGFDPDEVVRPADEVAHHAPASAIARANLATTPQTQILRYAQHFGQPVTDFRVHNGKVIRKVPEKGTYAYVEPESVFAGKGVGDTLKRAGEWAASGSGQAISTAGGAAGTALGAAAGLPAGAVGAIPAGMAGGAAGEAGGEAVRQWLDRHLASDEQTPMDWENLGWHALQGATYEPGGRLIGLAGKGALEAGKRLAAKIPGFGSVAPPPPAPGNPLQLPQPAMDAIRKNLSDKWDEIQQIAGDAREYGYNLSIGQITRSPTIQKLERLLAGTPEGAEEMGVRRRAQNEVETPSAVGQFLDEVVPRETTGNPVTTFRGAADEVVKAEEKQRTENAAPIYKQAFAANPSVASPKLDEILNSPHGKDALKYAVERMQNKLRLVASPDPELTAALKEAQELGLTMEKSPGGVAPGLKLQTLDFVKQGLWDEEQALRRRVESGTARAGEVKDISALRQAFTRELDKADEPNGGFYQQARKTFADDSEELDNMLEGGVGYLRKMSGPDRQNMVTRVFSKGGLMDDEIARMRGHFENAGKLPEWNAGIRSFVEDRLENAIGNAGDGGNAAYGLHKGLWQSPQQARIMKAALGDPAMVDRWDRFGEVLRRAGSMLPEGSPTGANMEFGQTTKGNMLRRAGDMLHLSTPTGAAAVALRELGDRMASLAIPEERQKLVQFVLSPDGDTALRRYFATAPTTAKAGTVAAQRSNLLLNRVLTSAGISTSRQLTPSAHGAELP